MFANVRGKWAYDNNKIISRQDKVFMGNKKNKRKMYEDTDYDALERSVKYIPWKGKKEEWYARRLLIFVVAIQLIDYLLGVCFIVSEDCEIIVFFAFVSSFWLFSFNPFTLLIWLFSFNPFTLLIYSSHLALLI